jgi:hypothetical protein|tara:strand:+ start:1900 stop:2175 length:276 start_codon:yes stop_codon:yes gene_type:complete
MSITAKNIDVQGNIFVDDDVFNVHTAKMVIAIDGIAFSPNDCVLVENGCEKCGEDTINLLCIEDEDGEKELITCKKCDTMKLEIRISEKNE